MKAVIWFIWFLLLAFLVSLLLKDKIKVTDKVPTSKAQFECTRQEPYPNAPELNRAVNLVRERIGEFMGTDPSKMEKNKNWLNCLNIQYKDLQKGVEGVFVFDKNSPVDNLQVYVDIGYKKYDDLLRAMLLSHELTHVLQFLQYKASSKEVPCLDAEVQAFSVQYLFFASLHTDEKTALAISVRKHLFSESYGPLIDMVQNNRIAKSKCGGVAGNSCYRTELKKQITRMVVTNPYYQKQCGL